MTNTLLGFGNWKFNIDKLLGKKDERHMNRMPKIVIKGHGKMLNSYVNELKQNFKGLGSSDKHLVKKIIVYPNLTKEHKDIYGKALPMQNTILIAMKDAKGRIIPKYERERTLMHEIGHLKYYRLPDAEKDRIANEEEFSYSQESAVEKDRVRWNVRKPAYHKIVMVSPQQFLAKTGWQGDISFIGKAQEYSDNDKNKMMPISNLKMLMIKGKSIDMPHIEATEFQLRHKGPYWPNWPKGEQQLFSHDGRHRAYAAQLAGEKKIPVIVQRGWKSRFKKPLPEERMDLDMSKQYIDAITDVHGRIPITTEKFDAYQKKQKALGEHKGQMALLHFTKQIRPYERQTVPEKWFKPILKPRFPNNPNYNIKYYPIDEILEKHAQNDPGNILNPHNQMENRLPNAIKFIRGKKYMTEDLPGGGIGGFQPTLIDTRGRIFDGRHRLLALKKLHYTHVPVEEKKNDNI